MRNLVASTVVLAALLALPATALAQILGPDGVKVGDAVQVGPGGVKVGQVQVPVPTPPPQIVEPVRQVVEPVRRVVEPVRQVVEPVRQVAEPVRQVTEPVRQVAEPPAPEASGGSDSSGGGGPAGAADPPPGGGSADGSPAAGAPAPRGGGGGESAPAGDAEGVSAPRGSSAPARAERRIRRTVARLSGCLDELPPRQHRVLALRGGVGMAPHSRRAVARRLGVPVARVRRMERRGLRRARGLARADACGEPVPAAATGGDEPATVVASTQEGDAAAGASPQSPDAAAQGAITSEQERGATRSEFAERAPQTPPAVVPAQVGIPLAIALALIALATTAGFYAPALRTRLRRR